MKDYLERTKYTQVEKNLITDLARYLYIEVGVGRKDGMGWNVCNDEDRERAIRWSIGIYLDIIKPHINRVTKDTQVAVKKAIVKKINALC